ncbi:MAG TPA: transposase, partial [Roseiflexaceae bacterium]|nr:transposase [Roseiflexaceae bacterium]
TEGDAVLIFDDTGFLKQGRSSVGVARQYTGTVGKVANCQVTVNCHYAERTIAWPIATRLYLPQEWCADATRRTKAHIPDDVQGETKPEIALALLSQAREWGVPHACVTADADYGDNRTSSTVWRLATSDMLWPFERKSVRVAGTGASGLTRVDAVLAARASRRWRSIRWREGSRGWLLAQFHAVRAWRQTSQGEWRIGWLIGEPVADTNGDRR